MMNKNPSCKLKVKQLDCPDCAQHIEKHLKSSNPDYQITMDILYGILTIKGENLNSDKIQKQLLKIGYQATPLSESSEDQASDLNWEKIKKADIIRLSIASAFMVLSLGIILGMPSIMNILLGLSGILIAGKNIFRAAWRSINTLRLDINALMTIAVIGAIILGEWLEAGAIVILFSIAELLEGESVHKSRNAIESLVKLSPDTATLIDDGKQKSVMVEDVKVGDVILVKPGGIIPIDGIVIEGSSNVVESHITGESIPQFRGKDSEVKAGSLNGEGSLTIRVQRSVGNTTLDKIINLVKQAQSKKAKIQTFVEKFAVIYTPIVVGLALVIATIPPLLFSGLWNDWFYRALTLLVISCPCALVISTPVTMINAISGAASKGILIKGSNTLESIDKINCIAFDKTGTLTEGTLRVTEVISLDSVPSDKIIQYAASVESHSEHPIARAIIQYADEKSIELLPIEQFRSFSGEGASASVMEQMIHIGNENFVRKKIVNGDSYQPPKEKYSSNNSSGRVFISNDNVLLGVLSISDTLRSDSKPLISALRYSGISNIAILSGDHSDTAKRIGENLNVDDVYSELKPEDKVNIINALRDKYGVVAMIGDGVNDAPALATADIGIAMGGAGNDAVLETADMVLMTDKLNNVLSAIKISAKANRIIRQNIFVSIAIKVSFVILAGFGWTTLWVAVMADVGLSLLVVLNSLRARNAK